MTKLSLSSFLLLAAGSPALASGTWTNVTTPPTHLGTMELLTDGTVIAQGAGTSANWYKLTPTSGGSYAAGTWSSIASMGLARQYTASQILPDGRMFVLGGEYSGPSGTQNWTNTGEIYNATTNAWTPITNFPQSLYGDVPSALLASGNILAGSINTPNTYIYNVAANTWSAAGTKLYNDQSDEETWVTLPDHSILSYDVFGTAANHAQRYIPSSNTWVDAGTVPVALQTPNPYDELGGGVRLPDGRIFFLGANSNTALYNPATNTWTTGPVIPPSGTTALGANDAPVAVMPNGKVLFVATLTPTKGTPTVIDEFDPTTNTITAATTAGEPFLGTGYTTRMLDLPSGEVLVNGGLGHLALYAGTGSPNAAWKPTIQLIRHNANGTYTLIGTLLNGIDEGASFGDDAEMSTNFPIAQFTDSAGHVLYGKTTYWTSTGVDDTGTDQVTITPPTGLSGTFTIRIVANGIASNPYNAPPDAFLADAEVPEPASLASLSLAAIPLLARRRKVS